MKAQLIGNYTRGVSTLEILIAFAVLTLSMAAMSMVVFGNQSIVVDTQTNVEAISKAQIGLEQVRALSRQQFSLVTTIPTFSWSPPGGLTYTASTSVMDLTQCKKLATSTVAWQEDSRTLSISFTTYLSDIAGALFLGGHCVAIPPSGNWQTLASVQGGDGSVNGTGVYVKNSIAYVSANSTSVSNPDLLIYTYDPGPPKAITPQGAVDISLSPDLGSSNGLNGVVVVGKYAYGINSQKDHQLVIIDVSAVGSPSVVSSVTLPNITAGFTCPNATNCPSGGRSIYYYKGYLYIGTGYLAFGLPAQNHEFHIYCILDASVPLCSPTTPLWMGSVNIGHNVNDIAVRGHYAYLATSGTAGELMVVDLNTLSAPPVTTDAPGSEDALSLYIIGNTLYLGRQKGIASEPDFIVYDITNPTSPASCATCATNFPEDINAITVFNNMAFLATSKNFKILDVTTPSAISSVASLPLQKAGIGIDYDDAFVYVPIVKQGSVLLNLYYPG